jgi:hypothetical protein
MVYPYPLRPSHHAHPHVAGAPAPASIAVQINNCGTQPAMFNGQSIPQGLAWVEDELDGFTHQQEQP